jgi:hypothetical protein
MDCWFGIQCHIGICLTLQATLLNNLLLYSSYYYIILNDKLKSVSIFVTFKILLCEFYYSNLKMLAVS